MRTVFQPKGGMCMHCKTGKQNICHTYNFAEMPEISKHQRSEASGEMVNVVVVKCSHFERTAYSPVDA